MTPTYTVRVSLNSVTYEVTADDEERQCDCGKDTEGNES